MSNVISRNVHRSPPIQTPPALRARSCGLRTHFATTIHWQANVTPDFIFISPFLIRHTNHLCLLHALIADPVVSVLCLEHLRFIGSVLRENCDFHRWTSWTSVNIEPSMFYLRTCFHGHNLSLRTPDCHNDYDAVSPQTAIARQTVREATTGRLVRPNTHRDDHRFVRCVLSCIASDTAPLFLVHLTPFTLVYTPGWIAPSIKVQCYVIPVVESTSLWFPTHSHFILDT